MGLFGSMMGGRMGRQWGLMDDPDQMGLQQPLPQQQPQERPQGFWQGGSKFGVRDGLAAALAAVGDAFAQQGGGRGGAVQMLAGGRMEAMERARAAQAAQTQRLQDWQDWKQRKDYEWTNKPDEPDAFTKTLISAGIDPKSPQGIELYRQRAATQAMPAPNLVGSPESGYRWIQPPAPSFGGAGRGQDSAGLTPMTPDEIRRMGLPERGPSRPTQQGGAMPDDAQMMERLYIQQFGEARGRPMFNEWLRLSGGGR